MCSQFDLLTNTDMRLNRNMVFCQKDGILDKETSDKFDNPLIAQAYWWALAKCDKPSVAFILTGNGYISNEMIRDKPIPTHLLASVGSFLSSLNRGCVHYRVIKSRVKSAGNCAKKSASSMMNQMTQPTMHAMASV